MEQNREKIIVKTSVFGIIGNIFLVILKAIIGFIVNSASLISDALNNLTDALSSLITIVGAKLSSKKPDRKHPFGHGRVEYITSSIIAALILFAGGTAIYESVVSIIDYWSSAAPRSVVTYEIYQLVIIAVAILVKIGLGLFFRKRANTVQSDALKSSGNDALFDSILSLSTLIAAFIGTYTNIYVEGYVGIFIGLFILKSGIEAMKDAISLIIGERFDANLTNAIRTDICSIDGVYGAYDLILNSYGPSRNIGSVHIGVKDSLTAKEIQSIERKIANIMYVKYNTIMTVGVYAENMDSEIAVEIKNKLQLILNNYPSVMQMHGFYVDEDMKFCNFDLVISFDDENGEEHFEEIKQKISKDFPEYSFYVNYDLDYSLEG